jgi:hypothetical protein
MCERKWEARKRGSQVDLLLAQRAAYREARRLGAARVGG